jgi:hypothetical protein
MSVDISRLVMYVIAATIVLCTILVLLYHGGVEGMPGDYVGLVGAILFTVVALAFTRISHDSH